MPTKAKSPATATAADDQTDVRSAEDETAEGSDNLRHDPEPTPAPERDSHDDVVQRLQRLEQILL